MVCENERRVNGAAYSPLPPALAPLKRFPYWVCYESVPKNDPERSWKMENVPVNARTGGNAMINIPSTWAPDEVALMALQNGLPNGRRIHGVSYALFKGSPEDRL